MPAAFEKIALGVSGLTALGIGIFIQAAPQMFFASYGVTLGDDPSLLSELRAPAAGLAAFGALMLVGIWHRAMAPVSRIMALAVFIAFPSGRLIGLGLDGAPSGPIMGALVFELSVAGLCIAAFGRRFYPARAQLSGTRVGH